MALEIFICYATADKLTADMARAALEAEGIRCWIAPRDVLPGMDSGGAIIEAIKKARGMLLIFSSNANRSNQVTREVEMAVYHGIPIIPFRIEEVPPNRTLQDFISALHWVDALTPPLELHLERLAIRLHQSVVVSPPERDDASETRGGIPQEWVVTPADAPVDVPLSSLPEAIPAKKRHWWWKGESITSDKPRLYPVWYSTNRKLITPDVTNGSYGSIRSENGEIHYGVCRVIIPKSHKIGSTGSSWWKRILTFQDDRLRLHDHTVLDQTAFWDKMREEMSHWNRRERVALVFIHGYNVSFEGAAIRAAQVGVDLQVPLTAFFSWPSKGVIAGYAADEASIEASEFPLAKFLTDFTQKSGASRVHLIAHSMGNRALLRSLQALGQRTARFSKVPFGQIFLAAPDVDAGVFCSLAKAFNAVAQHTTLYVSKKDRALAGSGRLHDYPRAGYVPPITVVRDVDTIEVSGVDISVLGHGYFAETRDLLQDIYTQIWKGKRPPRFGLVAAQTPDGQKYWRIGR
jgi:esterase/lipase superfamily enzyme